MIPSNENEEMLEIVRPYLNRILANHPQYGTAGFIIVFTDGQISRIDISESVQRKITPRTVRTGGRI